MKKQDVTNYRKYYTPHHFIFLPLTITCLIISATYISKYPEHALEWMAITILFFMILFLAVMMRQHYALGNQNRIVRLEMRLRYYELTKQRFESVESKLKFSQLLALRFASNEELLLLIDRTLKENLSADTIKKLILNWYPDDMRV